VARDLYAMGRDGILPRRVFVTFRAFPAPRPFATLVVSVISLAALWIDLVTLDFGGEFRCVCRAFSAVNLCLLRRYYR